MNIDKIFDLLIKNGKIEISELDNIGMIQEELENRSIETFIIDDFLIWSNKIYGWRCER